MDSRGEVRSWAWRFLAGEFASRAPAQDWADFRAKNGAGQDSVQDFARALEALDRDFGTGDGRLTRETGRRFAAAWARHYEMLVAGLRGHPDRLLRLLAEEVFPSTFGGDTPIRIQDSEHASLRFEGPLPRAFHEGLVDGFASMAGGQATTRWAEGGRVSVAWRMEGAPRSVTFLQVAASAIRFPFLVATVVPVFVALAIAAGDASPDVVGAGLTLAGVLAFQFGANSLNDFYDRRSGDDEALPEAVRRAPAAWVGRSAYAYYAVGVAVGLVLVAQHGVEVLWLGLAGFLLGVLYTAPPVRLAYRGLGELAVAVGFGPLIVLGTYFVQRHTWSVPALLASVPLAFLIAAVLYLHEMPDRAGDARVGKRTLIVRLPERPAVIVYVVLQALTYLLIVGGVALASVPGLASLAFPAWSLLGLLTLPLAARATVMLARNYRYPYRLVPTNAAAIRLHLLTAVLFAAGYAMPPWP